MSLKIEKPGLLTTIQDTGRYGFQKDGVIVSGAMDTIALRISNLLVGNNENEAAIEITLTGPSIRFEKNHLIALTGADISPSLNGKQIKMWRPVWVPQGSLLTFGQSLSGCRAYLALAGGFVIDPVMGSASTYLRAGLGGLNGRDLQTGDVLHTKPIPDDNRILKVFADAKPGSRRSVMEAKWTIDPNLLPLYKESPAIRVVRGPEFEWFSESSREQFWEDSFMVTSPSDRMGYLLQGNALYLSDEKELISSAVTFGTIQIPSQGNPIVLMADHQTTGGYPRMAQVISADLPVLAQVVPGKSISFSEITLEEAQYLYIQQEKYIEQLKRAIETKIT